MQFYNQSQCSYSHENKNLPKLLKTRRLMKKLNIIFYTNVDFPF